MSFSKILNGVLEEAFSTKSPGYALRILFHWNKRNRYKESKILYQLKEYGNFRTKKELDYLVEHGLVKKIEVEPEYEVTENGEKFLKEYGLYKDD